MKFHGNPTHEPGRPVYVLLHKSQTHVASLPDGSADWDYSKDVMTLRKQILEKDFQNTTYEVTTAANALTLIANKQAELEEAWEPALKQIRKCKELTDAWDVYKKASKKLGPHPLRFDEYLKMKLQIN